jgi:hypothetical protein
LQAPQRASQRASSRAASLLSRDPSPNGAMSMKERTNQAKIAEVVKLKKAAILQLEKGLTSDGRSSAAPAAPF